MSSTPASTGTPGTVVVIDSGWSSSWPTGTLRYQKDFYHDDGNVMVADANPHGAMVTASLLQKAPDLGVIALKVMPDAGGPTNEIYIEQALQWVVANAEAYNVLAVNLSIGGGKQSTEAVTALSDELATLAGKGVLTVAAGGNAGNGGATQDVTLYASDPNIICASASTGTAELPYWSQRSAALTDICADGTEIAMTNLAGKTYLGTGSSYSAPAVTAAVALAQRESLKLTGERLTQAEFLDLANSTGTPIGNTGFTELDTAALLDKVAQTSAVPAAGTATIAVKASGSPAGGTGAHFNLLIDGKVVGGATAGATAKDFTFTVPVTNGAPHAVQIQYDNDGVAGGQDRNLFVESVSINGHSVAPTASNVTYDKGALDGKDVAAGQSALWWSGTLAVAADKSWFPEAGDIHAVTQALQAPLDAPESPVEALGYGMPVEVGVDPVLLFDAGGCV